MRQLSFLEARCIYADGAMHSNCLIAASIGIVNFASSIGLEAIVQGKPVCNPAYLTENSTIFTGSGVVFDAFSDEDVVRFAHLVCQGETPNKVSEKSRLRFLNEHVMNWTSSSNDLLDNYEKLLTS